MKFMVLPLLIFPLLASASPKPRPQVSTQVAKLRKISKTLIFPALVKSRIESNIKADEDLIVIRPMVALGQKVKKGDKLIELRNQNTSVNYNNKIVRAQVSGTVAAIMVDQGQYIEKGQELIMLNDPEKLYLKLEVPVAHYEDIKTGIKAQGNTALIGGKPFLATVSGIGAVINPISGTVPVELTFTEGQAGLLPGTITNVELMLSEEEKLLVPEKAIYYVGEKTYIPLLKDGKVKKVEVKLGNRQKGELEVLEGVSLDTTMIVGAGEFLKDDAEVEVVKQ
jgi:RND family efflux transporter MFP subunit